MPPTSRRARPLPGAALALALALSLTACPSEGGEDEAEAGAEDDVGTDSAADEGGGAENCTVEGAEIVALVNAYREANGKPAVPLSPSLCTVAQLHVEDLDANGPHTVEGCNLHSWSDQGEWSACCYTSDHAQAQCMWDKPKELTTYPGSGYENAAGGGGSITPSGAVDLWKGSAGHNAVMLNEGTWESFPWGAMGAGVQGGYAVVWFGEQADPAR
ncbi:hypothetical protein PPSIR1_21744 [Plesiocystis pacifica SIR-1]|uniref:SCP domain-containing protein n=1 Tax=Plesiocystis pacifica SIR-1 TaxID=391625 RepID=A6FXJ6_9BACT|nr:CAP domain-containing protein [Plesiocystis pacifica]EDM81584.1 hypothetical protein PPSIR1_21744 [Plesiocystis pacifica SIR-1]